MKLKHYPELLSVRNLREIFDIGRNKTYELLERGTIKGFKVGRDWRVPKDEVKRYIEENCG